MMLLKVREKVILESPSYSCIRTISIDEDVKMAGNFKAANFDAVSE